MEMPTDHSSLEEFVRALAKARRYRSSDLGYEDSISDYWRDEAIAWADRLDKQKEEPCEKS